MKKIMLVALSVLLVFTLVGCGSNKDASGEKTFTLKVANYFPEDHPQNQALKEKFKAIVEEKSEGKIKVEIYANSVLGGEEQFIDGVKNGTIEMAVSGGLISKDYPVLGVLELPYLFRDYEHAQKVLESEIGAELSKDFVSKMGFRSLGYTLNGARVVSSNKEIRKFEDFKGFRLRVPNVDRFIKMGEALGTNPSPMPMPEVFTALEQNVIDGQENPYATIKGSGWWEAQKYIIDTRHATTFNYYIINENFYQSLGEDLQKVVEEAAKEAAAYEWQLLKDSEEADMKFLEEKGLEIIVPDPEFKQKLIDSQAPVREWFYEQVPGSGDIAKKIQDM